MSKKQTVALTFRLPVDVLEMLDELCGLSGVKRGELIVTLVVAEYDKYNGNPKLQELMRQMRDLKVALDDAVTSIK